MTWWRRQYTLRISLRGCFLALLVLAAVGATLTVSVYFLRAPILTAIGRQLIDEDALAPADAIVVLAGGTPERELEAVDLFRDKIAPVVVLTRESVRPGIITLRARGIAMPSPLDVQLRILGELGVPSAAIIVLDPVVESTVEEARVVAAWARARHARSLLVVTSSFHTGRVKLTYRHVFAGSGITFRVRSARADSYRPETWWHSRADLRNVFMEWQKQVVYRIWY